MRQPASSLHDDLACLRFAQRSGLSDQMSEVGAFNEFGDEILQCTGRSRIHSAHDVGMTKLSETRDFLLKSLSAFGAVANFIRHELDGKGFAQRRMPSEKHLSHAAAADALAEFVVAEAKAGQAVSLQVCGRDKFQIV